MSTLGLGRKGQPLLLESGSGTGTALFMTMIFTLRVFLYVHQDCCDANLAWHIRLAAERNASMRAPFACPSWCRVPVVQC